ncbi:MAG: methyltransferase domain-containing protein [Burkholderiaceae bacterium]
MNAPSDLPARCRAPSPALIVVGRAGDAGPADALDDPLLAALPPAARVLEVRLCGDALRRAYCRLNPGCAWTVIDLADAQRRAAEPDDDPAERFDLIVLPEALPWLADPAALLRSLARRIAGDGRLVLSTLNHATPATLKNLLDGDLSLEPGESLSAAPPRLVSPASAYKLLMDAGWMPALAGQRTETPPAEPARAAMRTLSRAFGFGADGSADRVHQMARLIIEARPLFADAPRLGGPALFDVLVPTNDERQLRVNVESSPGLREVDAAVVSYRGAATPAEAWERGRAVATADWVLLCHQDVYFPAGFGHRLNAVLAAIPAERRAATLLGFIGVGAGAQGRGRTPAGFAIDRQARADHPASDAAVSIDELAVVMARDSVHRIDPALGWHLWATDLCLSAIVDHHVFPRIVRLPLFHNSRTGWQLPARFHESAAVLARKWAGFGAIHTLCGVIDAGPVAEEASHP